VCKQCSSRRQANSTESCGLLSRRRSTWIKLPQFFVIGPPRTGTSWLHQVLSTCTHLPYPTKETRFFDKHFHRGFDWYLAHYPRFYRGEADGRDRADLLRIRGSARAHRAYDPDARIVCIFRNPVERVVSLYRLKRAYGMIPWSLEQAIVRDPELMESSKYVANLKAWQRVFGADRVRATVYDDLRDDPQAYVDALADFIGVSRFKLVPSELDYVYASEHMTHPRNYYPHAERDPDGGMVQGPASRSGCRSGEKIAALEVCTGGRSTICRFTSRALPLSS